ncbi:hypothetical protein [Sporisorium scitamineum]|nr:hypothetical protein [Sporisorium scitamineum]
MFNFLVATTQSLAAHQELFDPALSSDLGRLYGFNARALAATKTSGREKAVRDQEAFYTCATYTGDAQFTAPILDYMAMQSRASADKADQEDRVYVYGYLLAHRPSSTMLEALTVVPEMTKEWAAFHTLDIPFVFGLTGTPEVDGHAFVSDMSQYGVDPDDDDSNGAAIRSSASIRPSSEGMTEHEKQLSLYIIRTWTAVTRLSTTGGGGEKLGLPDGSAWLPLGSNIDIGKASEPAEIGRIQLLAFGEAPQAPARVVRTTSEQPIRIWQTELSQHAFAQQLQQGGVNGMGSLQARVRFWMHESITGTSSPSQADGARDGKLRMCRSMQNYYGFLSTPPRFLPWSTS